jgi:hypothetical protein
MQLKAAGGAPEATLLQMDGSDAPMSAKEREELAVALTAGEGDRRTVDAQVRSSQGVSFRYSAVLLGWAWQPVMGNRDQPEWGGCRWCPRQRCFRARQECAGLSSSGATPGLVESFDGASSAWQLMQPSLGSCTIPPDCLALPALTSPDEGIVLRRIVLHTAAGPGAGGKGPPGHRRPGAAPQADAAGARGAEPCAPPCMQFPVMMLCRQVCRYTVTLVMLSLKCRGLTPELSATNLRNTLV